MPEFNFQIGVNVRAYGHVDVTADTIEQAVAMLTADFVAENIRPGDIEWGNPSGMTIIDARAETDPDTELEDYTLFDLPSWNDPPTFEDYLAVVPEVPEQAARRAIPLLKAARNLLKAAGASRAVDKVRLAITSAGGAVRHAQGKAAR